MTAISIGRGAESLTRVFVDTSAFYALEDAALNVYERLDDARLSFTDCVSFAVMHALEISTAFAFDGDFERAGFQLVHRMVF